MSREEKKLRKSLDERARRELRKANKHMSKIRQNEPKPPRQRIVTDDEMELHDSIPAVKQPRKDRGNLAPHATAAGWVVETGPGFCDVLSAGARVRCRGGDDVAIGDQVLISTERRRVEEILPRRTVLSRSDPHNPRLERVTAANIDVVVNVVSIRNPPLRPGLIDRYLIAIGKSGAEPILCVNKMDLLPTAEELKMLQPYEAPGLTVIRCSAATGEGIEQLSEALAGKLCVFAGHSGVGKSSLLNALDPQLDILTAAVSTGNDKGRHTTTASALYHLSKGAMVIDTPGIREFGLWDVNPDQVRQYYHEFQNYRCGFSDCSHTHEPDCGVKSAVESGEVSRVRYEGYLRILQSLRA